MLKIYGSMLCPDCVACVAAMKEHNMEFEFYDFKDSLKNLKEFLLIRDQNELFDEVRENGKIGIPCIVDESENVILEWQSCIQEPFC